MPDIPNPHALASMLLTVVALILFSRDRLRLEITSLGLICILAMGFSLFPFGDFKPTDFFFGFGHEALIAVSALMVLGQGLVQTAALEPVGRLLGRFWVRMPYLSFMLTLALGAVLSAFVNNTPIVVLLLPILVSVCLRAKTSPSKILMPMGFATLIGGMGTTIGTSTNLLVVSVASDLGLERFGLFDFVYPAAIGGMVGFAYLWLVAPLLLPSRDIQLSDASPRLFDGRLHLTTESPAVGKTLSEAVDLCDGKLEVMRIRRGEAAILPFPDVILRTGDRLRVRDTPQNLKLFEDALRATLHDVDPNNEAQSPLSAEHQSLAEIAVVAGSRLDRTSLSAVRFLDQFQLVALALHRAGREILGSDENIERTLLQPGDILLVQGAREQIARLKKSAEFLVLDATVDLPQSRKAPIALGIFVAVIAAAATGLMPIAVSATTGACLMLLTRCLTISGAIRAINSSVFFVVVASLALGRALVETGATDYLTDAFLFVTWGAHPLVILGALMLLLAVLTNVVSNNAAAVVGTPIAIGIAQRLGLPPEPFVLAVLFGANMSYVTPMSYQTNLLVMSAGNYRFAEFVKVGAPLTVLMLVALTWALAEIYF